MLGNATATATASMFGGTASQLRFQTGGKASSTASFPPVAFWTEIQSLEAMQNRPLTLFSAFRVIPT